MWRDPTLPIPLVARAFGIARGSGRASELETNDVERGVVCQYQESGRDARGGVLGEIRPTGLRPRFTPRLEQNGFKLPPEIFGVEEFGPRRR